MSLVPRRAYIYLGPGRMFTCWRWLGRGWRQRPCDDWIAAMTKDAGDGAA